jgi:hypothetical protein
MARNFAKRQRHFPSLVDAVVGGHTRIVQQCVGHLPIKIAH